MNLLALCMEMVDYPRSSYRDRIAIVYPLRHEITVLWRISVISYRSSQLVSYNSHLYYNYKCSVERQ